MAGSTSSRPRFAGDGESLKEIFSEFFTTPTKVTYGEDSKTAKVDKREIAKCMPLLLRLVALQSNLAFTPMSVKTALAEMAEGKEEWHFDSKDIDHFSSTMSNRVRCLCRHVSQALIKGQPPKWALPLLPDLAPALPAAAICDSSKEFVCGLGAGAAPGLAHGGGRREGVHHKYCCTAGI